MANPVAESPYLPPPDKLFRTVVPPTILPVYLSSCDGAVVATALPAIAGTFGHVEHLAWIIVGNLIATTIAAPVYGRLGDAFGRKRMLIVALCIFLTAALLCALAPSFWLLLAARILQGFGAGGLTPMSQALLGEYVPPRQRGTYQSYLSADIVAGSTIGPLMGGLLTAFLGWRFVFLAYLPIGLVGLAVAARLPVGMRSGRIARFDLGGLALLTGFIVPLLLTVSSLQHLNVAALPETLALTLVTVAALVALLWQQRQSAAPLLPLPLFQKPDFWRSTMLAACSGASLTAMMTFLPIYLEVVTGANTAEAGLLLIPLTGAVSVGGVVTGWLVSRTGRLAVFPMVGLAITAACLITLAIVGPELSHLTMSALLAVGGMAQGSAMITAQITVQAVSGQKLLGAAAGATQLSRSLGSAVGTAVAGAVLFSLLSFMNSGTAGLFVTMVSHGTGVLGHLAPAHRLLVRDQIADAFRGVFLTVACFSCIIVACAATMPMRRL